ncbi:hypothetical protein MF271_20605 (plasmid) [Deinococcus sp. KNUC1210]|uniref:hypothetical protein n=1 Tax=Deinococcus sp. KNUC1210 TaxID=2917691 RepID=UPI001EF10AE6|nr:hypothetical protein [Deinococcus sp. KNUC1210]ULH17461.1 hypothetical protein MF271_20605 [Deinococcus sp. KNUC1210]
MSQAPNRSREQPISPEGTPSEPTPSEKIVEVPLIPPDVGIIEPGLDEEGIIIDIMCRG